MFLKNKSLSNAYISNISLNTILLIFFAYKYLVNAVLFVFAILYLTKTFFIILLKLIFFSLSRNLY